MNECDNYNRIIEAIEENIQEEEKVLYELAANTAGLSRREAALIVKYIEGEDYNMYIKRRKIVRCAQQKILNPEESWVDIAADFAMFDYSTFNRRFKAFLGLKPEEFPKEFKGDIMEMKPSYIGKENVIVKTQTIVRKETTTVYVPSLENTKKVTLAGDDVNSMGKMLKTAAGINNKYTVSSKGVSELVLKTVSADEDAKKLSAAYKTIMELEEIRAIYSLKFEEVLYLYLKNDKNSSTLYDKCEKICDSRIEQLYGAEPEYVYVPDWEEWEQELYENEMSISEAYAYYQGEDEMEYDNEDGYDNDDIRQMYW